MNTPTSSSNSGFASVEQIEEFLTTGGDAIIINIWNNLQESFDTVPERIAWFNKIAAKRGVFAEMQPA